MNVFGCIRKVRAERVSQRCESVLDMCLFKCAFFLLSSSFWASFFLLGYSDGFGLATLLHHLELGHHLVAQVGSAGFG